MLQSQKYITIYKEVFFFWFLFSFNFKENFRKGGGRGTIRGRDFRCIYKDKIERLQIPAWGGRGERERVEGRGLGRRGGNTRVLQDMSIAMAPEH